LNHTDKPLILLVLVLGGKVHTAVDGWVRHQSVERIPITQNKVPQDKPLSFQDRPLPSIYFLFCLVACRMPAGPLYQRRVNARKCRAT
jgi:hypothetical protein